MYSKNTVFNEEEFKSLKLKSSVLWCKNSGHIEQLAQAFNWRWEIGELENVISKWTFCVWNVWIVWGPLDGFSEAKVIEGVEQLYRRKKAQTSKFEIIDI